MDQHLGKVAKAHFWVKPHIAVDNYAPHGHPDVTDLEHAIRDFTDAG